jgi:hypothetical protein
MIADTRSILSARIGRLQKKRARAAAFEPNDMWCQFKVAPSCPPDKRLHIRGGIATPEQRIGAFILDDFLPDWICDFENEPETQMDLNFTNAGYYLPLILCYYWDWVLNRSLGAAYAEPVFDNVIGNEVATTQEAEAQIDAFLNGYTDWYYYRMPLWAVILQNDGQAGVDYAILPVDAVNRGRSYLYRDARAKFAIFP